MSMKSNVSPFLVCAVFAAACSKAPVVPRATPLPPKVEVGNIAFADITDYGEHTGWLAAKDTVDIRAQVRGYLLKTHFKEGQLVKKGDLLFEIDKRPFEAQLAATQAQAKALRAQKIAAEKETTRQQSLLAQGGASQSLVDKLVAETGSLTAQIEAAEQQAKRQELDVEFATLRAPLDGRIGEAQISDGNLVNAGGSDNVLARIVSIDPMYAYFTIDERSLQDYRQQQLAKPGEDKPGPRDLPFEFALDIDKGFPRKGSLDFANVQIDSTTGTITVRGNVQNPNAEMIAGSRIRVRIATAAARKATVVPDSAILADQDRRYVLAVDKDNVVKRRDVRLGTLLDDGRREVTPRDASTPAFTAEDRIVVSGLLRARLNERIEPIAAK